MADYEAARKEIEDPDSVYRPEGMSAEDSGFGRDMLQAVGIVSDKRRDIEVARTHYRQADEIFTSAKELEGSERQKRFREAAEQYKLAANNWQSSGLEQDALLMAAEAHFFAEDYYRAEAMYAELVKEYPRNPYLDHIDSRRFEIADYWLKYDRVKPSSFVIVNVTDPKRPWNDTGGHGKRVLEKMRLDNPTGRIGDDATMRLAMDHYEEARFEEAADAFADLRMSYPDSEHQFNAQLLEMQSLLASYQGPDYSSLPISDAQKRVEQLRRQFPQQAAEHQEELQEASAKIRFAMAERIWSQARYRRWRSEYGAARFHYRRILEDYPDTPFADRAREAMEEIKDRPDTPPQRFKALLWLLGSDGDDRPWREKADDASEQ
jgi:outer membrane protein assembly factor BamD (BamD/ComL family)